MWLYHHLYHHGRASALLPVFSPLQTALLWAFSCWCMWSKDLPRQEAKRTLLGHRFMVTNYFSKQFVPVYTLTPQAKTLQTTLEDVTLPSRGLLEFQNTGQINSHTCHLEVHSHKHSSRGRRGFVVYIIFNKEGLEMSGFAAPWLKGWNLPRINVYYADQEQNTL